ncbi:MAG: glutamate-5-semialdehyde dehydrogenase [Planctomycetes bacterium]|nr:glutamate-5-semialdehyde dehydrogenase [Planctomycetota bacterium]
MNIQEIAAKAKQASIMLAGTSSQLKNAALSAIAKALKDNSAKIIAANKEDLANAEKDNLAAPLLKRLKFDESKINGVCDGIESLIKIDDPVGKTTSALELNEGLELYKVSCPIGVIGVIFESRPDALVQISTLCLKSGNATLLKGGSEAANTNKTLAEVIAAASETAGIAPGWLGLMETRDDVAEMLNLHKSIDLIIPRGSNEFVQHIMTNTTIPVMGHADGICHVYVDSNADLDMAVNIAVDSKCQYCAVCNAMETLLVDKASAEKFLPMIKKTFDEKQVEVRGCQDTAKVIDVKAATEEDWKTEYLDMIVSIKIVDDLDAAIDHINKYGSGHTDTIVTKNTDSAEKFMDLVDSADVFFNCSTRFSDGFRFGLGAEVGISTNKIHARGPVGMEGLLIYKWKMKGSGHIVADFSENGKKYTHKKIDKTFKI